jgi:tetratricopeptide (TPR) repeat protein
MGYDRDAYQRNRADAIFRMGFHSEVMGKVDDAIRKYEKAIEAFPAHYESHVQLGRILKKNGMVERASHHEEMARRSKLKIPLWEPRKEPEERKPTPLVPVNGSVDPMAGEAPNPEEDAKTKDLLPLVWDAFFARFEHLRDIQRKSAPVVLRGQNALIISSTAGG